ncbi:DUF3152 domain-containing protein [Micromonospora sp. WMMD980]|uniref:DUF3152 domain-containing protein n=1 Tax=Micromonospora sp. WMMD980 TaxID=3016088 RepID=UPI0024163350|nr:DUF3152 domain-containing protein [Micromonospora sp. WMMD980]MDG4804584.1 DUF3152 domain-containing protein [Micromonospora sp. WMMD980]
MPSSRRPRAARSTPLARRWRTAVVVCAFLAAAGMGVGVALRLPSAGAKELVADGFAAQSPEPAPAVAPSSAAPPPVTPRSPVAPVLALPGPVPAHGRGGFSYDDRAGGVLGRAGELRRFRVAVEVGSGERPGAFGDAVQRALAGPGSWVESGRLRLRRVAPGGRYDFTIYLATRDTALRLCGAGGIDIRKGGVPYTSCRVPGKVVINLDRWRTSAPHLVAARMPLDTYRLYVVNHEVGHQLGHHHEACPGPGRQAPVMQQQTLFLDGCRPNPWPYLGGKRYAGPSL